MCFSHREQLGTNILQSLVGCELVTFFISVTKHPVKSHLEAQEFIWSIALTAHHGSEGKKQKAGQSLCTGRQEAESRQEVIHFSSKALASKTVPASQDQASKHRGLCGTASRSSMSTRRNKNKSEPGYGFWHENSYFFLKKKNRKSIVPISIANAKLPFVNLETFRNASLIQLEEGELGAVCIEREDLINITKKKKSGN